MLIRFFVTKIIFLSFILVSVSTCIADSDSTTIRTGTEAFQKGEFKQAAKAFANAAENSPNDLRLTYNHGIALAASGELDHAIDILSKSALDRNPKIAVLSLEALAQIHIDKARKQLPEEQSETPKENRDSILELINKAEQYYSNILEIEPKNENAKHNIELLRSWQTKIKTQWELFDRKQERQKEPYNRFDWIEELQRNVSDSISQAKELKNSPKKFQELYKSAEKQKNVIEELDAVQDDLKNQLESNNTQNDEHREQLEILANIIDQIRNSAGETKQSLDNFDETDAQKKADSTNKQLSDLKFAIASSFEQIAQGAEKIQTRLIDNNSAISDLQRQIYEQQKVANLMPSMLSLAEKGLADMRQNQADMQQNPQKKAIELAVKYAPEIQQLARDAAELLIKNNFSEALPKQKNAQKLLREILNQQNQNQNQDQNQDQNKDQNQDQNQDQNKDQNQDQDQKNESENKNENDQKNNTQNNDDQSKQNPDERKQDENKKDLTNEEKKRQEEKTERLIRQVKRKQQEANERREELKYYLLQPSPVNKDW
ncbi:MAG: hypothetical protein LBE18_04315 [Planctomycetaceae bacterium]|jgi:hypothetical protein|nr:hypothetical protein [Planctomycetaceae bacterium]